MANRVIVGAYNGSYGLRVSRPGCEVTAALPTNQVAFDSQWFDASSVYMTGSIQSGPENQVVWFGTYFPSPPICFVIATSNSSGSSHLTGIDRAMHIVYNDALVIWAKTFTPGTETIRYLVLRNQYG